MLDQKMKAKESKAKRIVDSYVLQIIFIIFVISLNFYTSSYLRESYNDIIWSSDDGVHITVTQFFRENGKFFFDTTSAHNPKFTIDSLIERYPTTEYPQVTKGPIYYVFLAGFYEILQTSYEDLWIHGTYFNTILISIFLILLFFLIKRNFGIIPAFAATILALFFPFFAMSAARVFIYPLLYIFAVVPLFFIGKKKTEYILFGIFLGLAQLTHPFGLYLVVSYNVFLLINRKFKGFALFNIVGIAILFPWLIRNYYYFQDIGRGLYVPLTENISELFWFLPYHGVDLTPKFAGSVANITYSSLFSNFYSPFLVFGGMFLEMNAFFHMGWITIFIIAFSGFAFFDLKKIKKVHLKYLCLILVVILAYFFSSFLITNYTLPSKIFQIFLIFVLPLILIFLLTKKANSLFRKPIPKLYQFILVSTFVTMIMVYFYALSADRVVPVHKHFLFQLFLLLPLSIVGITSLLRLLSQRYEKLWKYKIPHFTLILVVMLLSVDMSQGLLNLNSYSENYLFEEDEHKEINKFLREEIDSDNIVGTNFPYLTSHKTDLISVVIPYFNLEQNEFEKYISHYDIKYLIFYWSDDDPKRPTWFSIKDLIMSWLPLNYFYEEFYSVGNSIIIKINHVSSSDISHPVAYAMKANQLELSGYKEGANRIYEEIRNFEFDSTYQKIRLSTLLAANGHFNEAIFHLNQILETDPSNSNVHYNLLISYHETGQREKVMEILDWYDAALFTDPSNEKILKSFGSSIVSLIQKDDSWKKIIDDILIKVKNFEDKSEYQKALDVSMRLLYINDPNIELQLKISQKIISLLIKLERYDEALVTYDTTIKMYDDSIKELQNLGKHKLEYEIQTLKISIMKGKATLLINLEDFHKANRVYLEILSIDKFDPDVYKKIAAYDEKYEKLRHALHNYEMALNLEPENDFLIEKIKELKDKIAV